MNIKNLFQHLQKNKVWLKEYTTKEIPEESFDEAYQQLVDAFGSSNIVVNDMRTFTIRNPFWKWIGQDVTV